MTQQTTRQRLVELLSARPELTPTAASRALYDDGVTLSPDEVVEQIGEVKDSGYEVHARPPRCKSCDFDRFSDLLNIPRACPQCRSEWIEEPAYTIPEQ